MRPGGKTKTVDVLLDQMLGFLDPLGNLHFLLAGQQWHLPHLLEIHPHRIIQNFEAALGLLFFLFLFALLFAFLVTIDFRGFDDVDLHSPELAQNRIEIIRVRHSFGQNVIEIVEGDVALFLRQFGQFADAALQIIGRDVSAIGAFNLLSGITTFSDTTSCVLRGRPRFLATTGSTVGF